MSFGSRLLPWVAWFGVAVLPILASGRGAQGLRVIGVQEKLQLTVDEEHAGARSMEGLRRHTSKPQSIPLASRCDAATASGGMAGSR